MLRYKCKSIHLEHCNVAVATSSFTRLYRSEHQVPVARLRLGLRLLLSLFPGGRPLGLASPVLGAVAEEEEVSGAAAVAAAASPLAAGAAAADAESSKGTAAAPAAFAKFAAAKTTAAATEEELVSTVVVSLVAAFGVVAVSRQGRFCPTTTVGALVQRFVPRLPPVLADGCCTLGSDEEGGGGRGCPE
jgi:hypothetical protein